MNIPECLIRPLVWEEQKISDQWSRLYAVSILGGYEVLQWSDGTFGGSVPSGIPDEPNVEFTTASLDAAQAAAEADYRARIGAALDLDAVVALVEAATALEHEYGPRTLRWVQRCLAAFHPAPKEQQP